MYFLFCLLFLSIQLQRIFVSFGNVFVDMATRSELGCKLNMTWHKGAGSNLLLTTEQFRTWCPECSIFKCYDKKKRPEKRSFSYVLVTKRTFLSQKSCSLGTGRMVAVAGSQCGRKAQAISVRKKVKQIDRCVGICKCPVGTDLKEIFEGVCFCA